MNNDDRHIIYNVVEKCEGDIELRSFYNREDAVEFSKRRFLKCVKDTGYDTIEEMKEEEDRGEDSIIISEDRGYYEVYNREYEMRVQESRLHDYVPEDASKLRL